VTSSTGSWDSGDLPPGTSYSVTFHGTGTYQYYCKHHKGMQGTIVVGNGTGPTAGTSGY
jgi:plastocyanin